MPKRDSRSRDSRSRNQLRQRRHLKYFADRRKIDFPLLSDPGSKIIRAYEVLNAEATGQFNGMARPGYFFMDRGA